MFTPPVEIFLPGFENPIHPQVIDILGIFHCAAAQCLLSL